MTSFLHVCAHAYQVYRQKSLVKHPTWEGLSDDEQRTVITGEFDEWAKAVARKDVHGEHGEINEAIDCIIVLIRRIMELTRRTP